MAQARTKQKKTATAATVSAPSKAAATKPAPAAETRAALLVGADHPVELESSQLYANTLAALTRARYAMLTLDWHMELNSEPPEVQRNAARTLASLENAIMTLSNKRLSEIATRMSASQAELKQAADDIDAAQQKLDNIIGFLNAATSILGVVTKILAA